MEAANEEVVVVMVVVVVVRGGRGDRGGRGGRGGRGSGEPGPDLTLSHKPALGCSVLNLARRIALVTKFFLQPKKLQPCISLA